MILNSEEGFMIEVIDVDVICDISVYFFGVLCIVIFWFVDEEDVWCILS